MSERPASADCATENADCAEPDANPHSGMSQQSQLIQLPQGREPRRWINELEWTDFIKEDPCVRRRPSSVVSIFRVPKFLKDTKKEAYVPQTVSLGPHHHGSAELPPMGHHKGRALRRMMARFNNNGNLTHVPNSKDFAHRAKGEILKLENKIRDSYGESIDCDRETLALMLSLDGCFILEVLRTLGGDPKLSVENYDPIFGEKRIEFAASDILNDILMLENQIPLIVLQKLLELELNLSDDVEITVDVKNMLLEVLVDGTSGLFNPFGDIKQRYGPETLEKEVHHLLGFLHTVIVSPPFNQGENVDQGEYNISIKCCSRQCECNSSIKCYCRHCIRMLQHKNKARDDIKSIPHAVELRNVGIKFKPCKGGINDIKFDSNSATIFLPPICITDTTEIVFRNLIAFEMGKPFETKPVTGYVNLMDALIDSQQDVALLRRMGVVTDRLGSDKEVAGLFNGLCKEATIKRVDDFSELREKVNEHYKNKIKVQIAELVQNHFSSPWKALALAGAVAILSLTAVQTIFSVMAVQNNIH